MLDLDQLLSKAYAKQLLEASDIVLLCDQLKELLIEESNVSHRKTPVTIVGDVHGQFFDLIEAFRIGGYPPNTNYIFLGDYVDRGHHSIETIALLICLKLRYPQRIALVRGNHESRAVTMTYGFYTECIRKYGDALVWTAVTDLFDFMVLAVEIDNTILCVHGGLSPSIQTIDQIRVIDRFKEIPHEGPMADLVWSDPMSPALGNDSTAFAVSPRGAGYIFGKQVVDKFLYTNNMAHICRAHQLCMEGYQILFDDLLSTIWSAPNYCYRAGNLASILEIMPSHSRYFNVFGACPTQDQEVTTYDRLDELFDDDGIGKKKLEMESLGLDKGHALYGDEDTLNDSLIDQYFT